MPALFKLGESLVEFRSVLGGGDVFSDVIVGCCVWKGSRACHKDSDKIGCYVHFGNSFRC